MEKFYGIDFANYPHVPKKLREVVARHLFINPSIDPNEAKRFLTDSKGYLSLDLYKFEEMLKLLPQEGDCELDDVIDPLFDELKKDAYFSTAESFAKKTFTTTSIKFHNDFPMDAREGIAAFFRSDIITNILYLKQLFQWGLTFGFPTLDELNLVLSIYNFDAKELFDISIGVIDNFQEIQFPISSDLVLQCLKVYGSLISREGMDAYLECYQKLKSQEREMLTNPN